MKNLTPTLLAVFLLSVSAQSAQAKMSVNEAQECQAVLEFTIDRVESVSAYDKANVEIVTNGLQAYNAFLQSDHVTPGLLEFTKGDKAAAQNFQAQIDTYKAQIVQALKAKYPQERIFSDQAVAINACYSKAPMAEDKLDMMTAAVQMIVSLAKQE